MGAVRNDEEELPIEPIQELQAKSSQGNVIMTYIPTPKISINCLTSSLEVHEFNEAISTTDKKTITELSVGLLKD